MPTLWPCYDAAWLDRQLSRLSGGDPERLAAAKVLLGAGEGFPDTVDETRH